MLSQQQKLQADAVLDELLDLSGPARWACWRGMSVTDPAVHAEVESFLRAAESVGDFLAKPARPVLDEFDDDLNVGTVLNGWRITARIGRGGMGEVYKAARAQGDFDQRVAIKVLQRGATRELERFQVERQILARLEHPSIARLLDGGTTSDGRPYMVMEYVQGLPITQYCASVQADLSERLRLFKQICAGVAYAHSSLVVHRDLKSSNILVTAGGHVKLLDFGIAKLLDSDSDSALALTRAPLTPACAAPEQLLGQPITTATDTYALGVLLFELLTGVHPWVSSGVSLAQAVRAVVQQQAPLASTIAESQDEPAVSARTLRGDLDAIIAKALRQEPRSRYVTADSLEVDVERYLRGEPVEAREGARLYVLGRLLKRHRAAVAGLSLVLVSLAGGLGTAAWQARRAAIERDVARRDASREEAVRYGLTRMFRAAISDKGGQTATAKSVIDQSAQRVLEEYREKPKLAGPLVLTLADLYGALEDVEGAGNLLDGFVAEEADRADAADLADARQKLANIELLRGNTDRSAQLLEQATSFWERAPQQYAEERLEGLGIRAKLERTGGDLDRSIRTSRTAIDERIALSGRNSRETAILYNSLAISLTSANRLEEALAAYRETLDIYRAIGLGDGLDAQIVLGNVGTLELRTGLIRDAQEQLKNAFEHERELAGDSAAVAAAMGYYGRALWILGHDSEAVNVLRDASSLAARYAGAASPVALQNRLFLGDAQLSAGDLNTARTTLSAAVDSAGAQYGPNHVLSLRARLGYARWLLVNTQEASAQASITDLIVSLRNAGAAAQPYLADALELQGRLALARHQNAAALESLKEAVKLRENGAPRSWELARTRELLGETLEATGDTAGARGILQKAATVLRDQLGAEHPQTIRAQLALSRRPT
jgi:eukaryotic-like serine/threonine-protein kinase